jgi:hypothetical protein
VTTAQATPKIKEAIRMPILTRLFGGWGSEAIRILLLSTKIKNDPSDHAQ